MEDCGSTSDGTDQESEGTIIATAAGITDCPANALMTWLGAAGITKAGTISRVRLTDLSVANVVNRMGLDAQHCHSLSSGLPYISGCQWGIHLQDDGRVSTQVDQQSAYLCPGRGTLQEPCWSRIIVMTYPVSEPSDHGSRRKLGIESQTELSSSLRP